MRYRFRLDRGDGHCPTRRRDFNRKDRTDLRKSSIPGTSLGPTGRGAGSRASSSSSTRCMSAHSRRMAAGKPLRVNCRLSPSSVSPASKLCPWRNSRAGSAGDTTASTSSHQPGSTAEPDDFRRFVDRAHALGIAVILDVVYNHFGPDGNYLKSFSAAYFTDRYDNEWGEAINFDGPDSGPAREFFVANAGYWIDEYHLDGLRLDATQQIFDRSEDHIIAAIVRQVRSAGRGQTTFVVGENEPQQARLVRPAERGGYGLDALWNDDFHHSAMVALTGHHEAYYSDYRGRPREFVAAAKHGFLYQGQRYQWQRKARGTPTLDLPAECFVVFLQNHDQIANSGTGERCHALTSPGRLRAMTAYFLLMPGIPMLFQGQEFGASSPFFYFADHELELSHDVREGRRRSLAQFPSLATSEMRAELADPGDIDTFRRSVIDLGERQRHASIYALHRDLLELRRTDPVLGQRPCRIDGAALTDEAWMLRFFSQSGADRLLIVNLGRDLLLGPAPEPLLAPIEGQAWRLLWSSEAPVYGGAGARRRMP